MKVPERIKEEIAEIINDAVYSGEDITAGDVMTTLVECGVIDEAFELYDEEGSFDEAQDKLAQAYVLLEINKQLKPLQR
jgi:hypothetical protein